MMMLLKISLIVFMAGNLLGMGLRLNPEDAIRGLRNARFVLLTLLWGFLLVPALAYGITRVIPLAPPYAIGLILLGMTPCAPFLPMLMDRAKGDLGFTAALMLLASVGTVVFMTFALPFMVTGLAVSAWTIAKPLLMVVLLPLAVGMVILHFSATLASKIEPSVKKVTNVSTILMLVLCLVVYGRGMLGVAGSFAVATQFIFFFIVTTFTYWFGFGLRHEQKIVLSAGMTTRNVGAALAPLFAISDIDQRATVMVVLGLPIMVIVTLLSSKWFTRSTSKR